MFLTSAGIHFTEKLFCATVIKELSVWIKWRRSFALLTSFMKAFVPQEVSLSAPLFWYAIRELSYGEACAALPYPLNDWYCVVKVSC